MKDHRGKLTTIDCKYESTIGDIKRKRIFDEGRRSYEADLFTLSFKDRSLQDDMNLALLYSPRED